jgi:hypothetical protein
MEHVTSPHVRSNGLLDAGAVVIEDLSPDVLPPRLLKEVVPGVTRCRLLESE